VLPYNPISFSLGLKLHAEDDQTPEGDCRTGPSHDVYYIAHEHWTSRLNSDILWFILCHKSLLRRSFHCNYRPRKAPKAAHAICSVSSFFIQRWNGDRWCFL